jgi:hypothetical protein
MDAFGKFSNDDKKAGSDAERPKELFLFLIMSGPRLVWGCPGEGVLER